MHIDSIKDPKIELARELTSSTKRKKHGKLLLFGMEHIEWALENQLHIDFMLSTKNNIKLSDSIPVFTTSEGILKKVTDTNYLVPIIAVADIPTQKHDPYFTIVFDNVVDFGNIGTIVRTANSFGIHTFFATNNTFDPFQRKTIDSSRGCVFNSSFKQYNSPQETIELLKKQGYQIIVTSPRAPQLQSQVHLEKKPIALVVGNETDGICQTFLDAADLSIQIPMSSTVESLNVGVFTGISLYELRFKMVLLMLKEKIFSTLGRQVNVTGSMIKNLFNHAIQQVSDISGMQVIFLMILHCDKTMSLTQISADVGLFENDLVNFLEPLQIKNLIQKNSANEFSITTHGEQFLAQIWPIVEKTNEQILQGFSTQEREQLDDFLIRIQNNCQI